MSRTYTRIHQALSLILLFAMLLAPVAPLLPVPLSRVEAAPTTGSGSLLAAVRASALYRTRLTLRHSADLARLEAHSTRILKVGDGWVLAVVNPFQLTVLARLGFQPRQIDTLLSLGFDNRGLADSPTLEALRVANSADTDNDGLTDTEEGWWCTSPTNANSDSDPNGYTDGQEVYALLDFTLPRSVRWGYGPPFGPPAPWPAWNQPGGCNDGDYDTIPDFAETMMVGSRVPKETTDNDKFDDGQELFGVTYCPGAPTSCGYGNYPRIEYWNYIKETMPNWVLPPGDNLFVAAFPEPEVSVVPGSWTVNRVTTITTSEGQMTETSNSYATSVTEGQSTSIADTVSWNSWEEVSHSRETPVLRNNALDGMSIQTYCTGSGWKKAGCIAMNTGKLVLGTALEVALSLPCNNSVNGVNIDCPTVLKVAQADAQALSESALEVLAPDDVDYWRTKNSGSTGATTIGQPSSRGFNSDSIAQGLEGIQYALDEQNHLLGIGLQDISYQLSRPRVTDTKTTGQSWGGAQTTTHEQYEEHSITEGQAFTSGQNWSTAWAVDSSHAADLTFNYTVENTGTEYAREITGLIFNIYLGDDTEPIISYPAWQQFPGGTLQNVFPGNQVTFASNPVPLTLEQMMRIDLGESLTVVLADFSYGADELFYQDAVNGGITAFIEDGVEDGDELVDMYVIPTWGVETVQDVLTRYFPADVDDEGNLNTLWTPEFSGINPPAWNEYFLSDIAWWNIYQTCDTESPTDCANVGATPLHQQEARAGGAILFRFNRDSDRDGYKDSVELSYGTDKDDPASHPQPELLAGYTATRSGDEVTVLLKLENTGSFDAYGIDAVMYAPDDTTTIGNNTVGGNGVVRPGAAVAVGSLILDPDLTNWNSNTADPYAGGNYTGSLDQTFTFSAGTPGVVGQGSATLNWSASGGGSGLLAVGSSYHSPLPIPVANGLEIGLTTGTLLAGQSFTVETLTPRDTFTYTVNSEVYAPPVIVVSYSDPQGSHKFITPVQLASLANDLTPYAGQMLPDAKLEIVAGAPFDPMGPNTTYFTINSPDAKPIEDAHLYVNFVMSGTVVAELPYTLTLQPGPTVYPVTWSTSVFTQTFNPDAESLMIAFWTDAQGNIIDSAARPLNTLQADPHAQAEVSTLAWDFGSITHGQVVQHEVAVANIGLTGLWGGTTISGTGLSAVFSHQGQMALARYMTIKLTLDTAEVPSGPYVGNITIRTNDISQPTVSVQVVGEILPLTEEALAYPVNAYRPWDQTVFVPGPHEATDSVSFDHTIPVDTDQIYPLYVYTNERAIQLGVGDCNENAALFKLTTASRGNNGPNAVDGDHNSPWTSGNPPPQWIEIDLGSPRAIDRVQLEIDQTPAGNTIHQVFVKAPSGSYEFLHEFNGFTSHHDILSYALPTPLENVQFIRVDTIQSPSWVAWYEVEVYALIVPPNCYVIRQLPGHPNTRIDLPEDVGTNARYWVQYGERGNFGGGGVMYHAVLPKQSYAGLALDALFRYPGLASFNFIVDIGADGSVEWAGNESEYPVLLSSPDLSDGLNNYLLTTPDPWGAEVAVPIAVYLSTSGDVFLTNMEATPGIDSDPSITVGDISVSNPSPTETEQVTVSAVAHNTGRLVAHNVVAALFAGDPNNGGMYLGSDFLPEIPSGGSATASLVWDTTGYTGAVDLYVVLDPSGQLEELNEGNNQAFKSVTVLTRPDLVVKSITPAGPARKGMPVNVTVKVTNNGQTNAGSQTISLYQGDPNNGGTLIGNKVVTVNAGVTRSVTIVWTPSVLGGVTLYAVADRTGVIDESDESNNTGTTAAYVGWGTPLYIDAGGAGDVAYDPAVGYGYLTAGSVINSCGSQPFQTYRQRNSGETLQYQFDHLLPGRFYHLDLTFFLCSGSRSLRVLVDGVEVLSGVTANTQGVAKSTLLDPTAYSDHQVVVTIEKTGGGLGGPVVSELKLSDIRYCYRDSGLAGEVAYTGAADGCGWLDGLGDNSWGNQPHQTVRYDDDGQVQYRFDGLEAGKNYQLRLTLYEGDGTGRVESVLVDGVTALANVALNNTPQYLTVDVPAGVYDDGSIVVTVQETYQPVVSELALEEKTGLVIIVPTPTPTSTPTPTLTPTPTQTPTPIPTNTPTPTPSPTPPPPVSAPSRLYVSSSTSGTAGGVSFADEDVLAYDPTTGLWSMLFDGSDVGLGSADVDAFSVQPGGSLLLSLDIPLVVGDLGTVDDSDILRFIPTSLGMATAGSFELFWDGSAYGLTDDGEDVDALAFAPDGRLLVSTIGKLTVTGVTAQDEDLSALNLSTGAWSLYFDGSDVGLAEANSEDVYGAAVNEATGDIYLTTLGLFDAPGVSGDGADIFMCAAASLGNTTSCAYSLVWDGSARGFGGEVMDALELSWTATPMLWVSTQVQQVVGGLTFADEDIFAYDAALGVYAMVFDGSDVGITGDVDAFSRLNDGSLLLSLDVATDVPGLGLVDDSDIVRFVPTSLGLATAGTLELYFDGSAYGLTDDGEDINALALAPDGRLLVSTVGNLAVNGLTAQDEDLSALDVTSGVWSLYFDGSDVALSQANSEDVNGVWLSEDAGQVYLTTVGAFDVPGVAGDGSDILLCQAGSLGNVTSCTYSLYWDGSAHGVTSGLDGLALIVP